MSVSNEKPAGRAAAPLRRKGLGAGRGPRALVGSPTAPRSSVAASAPNEAPSAGLAPLLTEVRFHQELRMELERARRSHRAVSLLLIHLGGDAETEATDSFAAALLEQKRSVDAAGRIADGRFAVLLPET